MKERNLIGTCKCCGQKIESTFVSEDVDYANLTLESYKAYKEFKVNRCPECDYVSDNIFVDEVPNDIREIIESADYQYVLNYEYIYEEVEPSAWEYEIKAYNPNEFEAYALILDCMGKLEEEIKSLWRSIELKEKLKKYLRKKQNEEDDPEDWAEIYDKVVFLLSESIEINLEEIEEIYADISSPNRFTQLIYIEALAKMGRKDEAKQKIKNLQKLPQDLTDYLKQLQTDR